MSQISGQYQQIIDEWHVILFPLNYSIFDGTSVYQSQIDLFFRSVHCTVDCCVSVANFSSRRMNRVLVKNSKIPSQLWLCWIVGPTMSKCLFAKNSEPTLFRNKIRLKKLGHWFSAILKSAGNEMLVFCGGQFMDTIFNWVINILMPLSLIMKWQSFCSLLCRRKAANIALKTKLFSFSSLFLFEIPFYLLHKVCVSLLLLKKNLPQWRTKCVLRWHFGTIPTNENRKNLNHFLDYITLYGFGHP